MDTTRGPWTTHWEPKCSPFESWPSCFYCPQYWARPRLQVLPTLWSLEHIGRANAADLKRSSVEAWRERHRHGARQTSSVSRHEYQAILKRYPLALRDHIVNASWESLRSPSGHANAPGRAIYVRISLRSWLRTDTLTSVAWCDVLALGWCSVIVRTEVGCWGLCGSSINLKIPKWQLHLQFCNMPEPGTYPNEYARQSLILQVNDVSRVPLANPRSSSVISFVAPARYVRSR